MTSEDRWLLPEGVEEILPPVAARLEQLRQDLLVLYRRWGYELVAPPFIEFLESLLTGTGNDLDLQTFKLIDQLSGRLMGIRADMTPQVARIEAHHLKRDVPVRLCYSGTVLHTRNSAFAGTRSPLQIGAELFGHRGFESDLEVLSLMLESLQLASVANVHVDLGHVGIFRALARRAGLGASREATLFEALQRKAIPELEQLLADWQLPRDDRDMLAALVHLNGGEEVLVEADRLFSSAGGEIQQALEYLHQLAAALQRRYQMPGMHFDLGELRGYGYHTGVVFSAYVPGLGRAVANGGRYDDIGQVFGRARPATGFSADLKTLLSLSADQNCSPPQAIYSPRSDDSALDAMVSELRERGEIVICELPGQSGGAADLACDRLLVRTRDGWSVEPVFGS